MIAASEKIRPLSCIAVADTEDGSPSRAFGERLASWAEARGISAIAVSAKAVDENLIKTITASYDLLIISLSPRAISHLSNVVPFVPVLVIANASEKGGLARVAALVDELIETPGAPRPLAFILDGGDSHIGAKLSARLRISFWGEAGDIDAIASRVLDSSMIIKEPPVNCAGELCAAVPKSPPGVHPETGNDKFDSIAMEVVSALRIDAEFKDMRVNSSNLEAREALRKKVRSAARRVIASMDQSRFLNVDIEPLVRRVVEDSVGLGPLETLMSDPEVTEIMVNGAGNIYAERRGLVAKVIIKFNDKEQVMAVVERMVASAGRRIDESSPMVDARLSDGSRLNVVIPPVSIDGPCITIRKFMSRMRRVEDIVSSGMITAEAAKFLCACVSAKLSIIISGGTGAGKTTLLNVLASAIGENERVVTIEDAAELKLMTSHIVRLEARPANIEGTGAISIRDLVKNALRMRPDRIVVGECRGPEALDMLQAMNTGHEGSLTTVHANSPRDAIARLETMVLMTGVELPLASVREQIVRAVDIIVQVARCKGGARKVSNIVEVCGMEGAIPLMQTIAEMDSSENLVPTGLVPRFTERLKEKGMSAPVFTVCHSAA